jgi:hypothetical protein
VEPAAFGAWLREAGRVRRPRAVRSYVERSAFAGFRFPPEVITVAVRWYLRYGLSYRDGEELLAERGIDVDHVTVYRWVQRFTPLLTDAARPLRHSLQPGRIVRRQLPPEQQSGVPRPVLGLHNPSHQGGEDQDHHRQSPARHG